VFDDSFNSFILISSFSLFNDLLFKSEESFNDVKFNELLFVLVIESIDISRCVINFVVVCICVVDGCCCCLIFIFFLFSSFLVFSFVC